MKKLTKLQKKAINCLYNNKNYIFLIQDLANIFNCSPRYIYKIINCDVNTYNENIQMNLNK